MAKRQRSRRQKIPAEPISAVIEGISHEGRGVSRVEGKALFVHNALPGETVTARYTKVHRRYDEACAVEVTANPHPHRVAPKCAAFEVCGGCSWQHVDDAEQIHWKQNILLEQFEHIGKLQGFDVIPPLTADPWAYRRKARLGVKYIASKDEMLVGFRERFSPYVARMDYCEVLHANVAKLIVPLKQLIYNLSCRDKIPQVEVAVGDDDVALIFRHLAELTPQDLDSLSQFAKTFSLQLYLQSGGPDTVSLLYPETAQLSYSLPRFGFRYEFEPTDFTQVNLEINRKMVDLALELLDLQNDDVVFDLFCGLGNFSLPIAKYAKKVIGVEGDEGLINRARRNASINGISNAEFYVADLTQDVASQPWLKERPNKVLFDPPRSGALEVLPHIAALQAKLIVYVSCNPATLARDAGELVNNYGYRLRQAGVMDMFPHTAHVESIAIFDRG